MIGWRRRHGAFVAFVALAGSLGVACGDDDEGGASDQATTTMARFEDTTTTTAPTDPAASSTTRANQSATTIAGTDLEGAAGPPADLTGEQVCELLPGEAVSRALDAPVAVAPGRTDTPQCSYRFAGADGVATEATVAALRVDGDLGGRVGQEAFAYVVDLNRQAAASPVTDTSLAVGDQGIILSGEHLHMAVVQLGDRIVTVIVPVGAAELGTVTALAAAAAAALVP